MTRITTYKQDSKLAFELVKINWVKSRQDIKMYPCFKENVQIGRSIILIYQDILFQLKYSG